MQVGRVCAFGRLLAAVGCRPGAAWMRAGCQLPSTLHVCMRSRCNAAGALHDGRSTAAGWGLGDGPPPPPTHTHHPCTSKQALAPPPTLCTSLGAGADEGAIPVMSTDWPSRLPGMEKRPGRAAVPPLAVPPSPFSAVAAEGAPACEPHRVQAHRRCHYPAFSKQAGAQQPAHVKRHNFFCPSADERAAGGLTAHLSRSPLSGALVTSSAAASCNDAAMASSGCTAGPRPGGCWVEGPEPMRGWHTAWAESCAGNLCGWRSVTRGAARKVQQRGWHDKRGCLYGKAYPGGRHAVRAKEAHVQPGNTLLAHTQSAGELIA